MNCIMNILLKIVNYIFFLLEYVFNLLYFVTYFPHEFSRQNIASKNKQTTFVHNTFFKKFFKNIHTNETILYSILCRFFIQNYSMYYMNFKCNLWANLFSRATKSRRRLIWGSLYKHIQEMRAHIYIIIYI